MSQHTEPKYLGVELFLAGRTLIVPALSMRQFRQHYEVLTNPFEGTASEVFEKRLETYVPIIGLALRRNYPEITNEDLLDELDLNTFGEAIKAVQAASGMKVVKPGEAQTQTAP